MKILFVCEGNINRSQMAEAFMRADAPEIDIASAGVYADHAGECLKDVPENPVDLMKDAGFDIGNARITQLTPQMIEGADMVILTGPVPRAPLPQYLADSPKLEAWDVPDPGYEQISQEDARDLIQKKVRGLAARLHNKEE
ncbi:MAG: low molecular weight phosphatase family protein [Candidatus Kaiserbacteria bacterium]|nr:low molecular weight phosphatase family protein [Candidatus Kaiserbacteria bacterium]